MTKQSETEPGRQGTSDEMQGGLYSYRREKKMDAGVLCFSWRMVVRRNATKDKKKERQMNFGPLASL